MILKLKYFLLKLKNKVKRYNSSKISPNVLFGKNVQLLGIDNIAIGANCTIGEFTLFTVNNRTNQQAQLTIGANSYVGRDSFFSVGKSVTVGEYCIFGNKCSFICSDHVFDTPLVPYAFSGNSYQKAIIIGVNCWLGHNVSVVGNVSIGHGCVIGANTLVTKDIPPFSMVVGNPARVIKVFNFLTGNWEKAGSSTGSEYENEGIYLEFLKSNFGILPLAYHSASSSYGDL